MHPAAIAPMQAHIIFFTAVSSLQRNTPEKPKMNDANTQITIIDRRNRVIDLYETSK